MSAGETIEQPTAEDPTSTKKTATSPVEWDSPRLMTIPNLLTGIRLAGSVGLVVLATAGKSELFAVLFVLLVATDWVDGKLARWLHQRTEFGARLDSIADAALFAALLFGCLLLKSEILLANKFWIAAVLLSYGVTSGLGLWKFGRLPAYHMWAAKTSWYFVLVTVVFVFFDWSDWPLRIAALAVTLTNLEATLITITLPRWQADVPSLRSARRIREESAL